MLNAFFVKLKYVSLRLLSDRRLRILFLRFFLVCRAWLVSCTAFCLLHYFIASMTTTRGGIVVRRGNKRGLATIAARMAVVITAITMCCTFSVVSFMGLFFNDYFFCVTRRSRPAGSVATWFLRNTLPAVSCHCSTPHPLAPVTKLSSTVTHGAQWCAPCKSVV